MSKIEPHLLKNKFRGSLLGSLVGDCLGAPFQAVWVDPDDVQEDFDKLESPDYKGSIITYTDDTAMMQCIAQSLVDKPEIDYQHMAELFVEEFFSEPYRGYGEHVGEVFQKLRNSKFEDIYKPASEQFSGSGSCGNGAAMRIAPIALYFYNDYDAMIEAAKKSARITHSHSLGVLGGVLQCVAVHQALLCDPEEAIIPENFCEEIINKMKKIDGLDLEPYEDKLKTIQNFLAIQYHDKLDDEVIENIGNSVFAHRSVPTALYCFLRALKNDIPTVSTDNIFRRTIQYAITLGGDTNTIACMAGAIAGAYLGENAINSAIHCENYEEVKELADSLYTSAADPLPVA